MNDEARSVADQIRVCFCNLGWSSEVSRTTSLSLRPGKFLIVKCSVQLFSCGGVGGGFALRICS